MELTNNHHLIKKLEYVHVYLHMLYMLHGVDQPIFTSIINLGRMQWGSWLRHCATSQKVTGSIPDGVTGTFH